MQTYCLQSRSPAYLAALHNCELVANSKVNVMLLGESGTGKDIIAQYIHACSPRSNHPLITVNCSAYPDTLLESELFGYESGAFTGAHRTRQGRFEQSHLGTLFIDEIGDISLSTQVKLLRAIETKHIERIGSDHSQVIDFRLISATNKDPYQEVSTGQMREDFLYRISTVVIRLPSLRDRPEDLEALIHYFLVQAQQEHNRTITHIDPDVRDFLYSYEYPGNLREMKNIVERMVVLSEDGRITRQGLPVLFDIKKSGQYPSSSPPNARYRMMPWREFKALSEADYLQWVLTQTEHNVAQAARLLHLSTRQLFNKISEYGLQHAHDTSSAD